MEFEGLVERGNWKIDSSGNVPEKANISNAMSVPAIKDGGTEKYLWEARFVVQRQGYLMKQSLVHSTPVPR